MTPALPQPYHRRGDASGIGKLNRVSDGGYARIKKTPGQLPSSSPCVCAGFGAFGRPIRPSMCPIRPRPCLIRPRLRPIRHIGGKGRCTLEKPTYLRVTGSQH